ncbi:hypothetical protein EHW99_3528 [Erwinia amylovora]|nr:hypothetical protein EHX00_3528 [Erwinia amylovora]QJQ59926.1 hypothetical protein EHW99_3528 [Erwinia amylovora]QJQ63625.1 hypothetical protein EHW98_3528 [Erwinia amylovora]QJQ67427.1 hypothetical protein EHW96_3528 [Erwinia amylovora]QJQ71126.1 hypothetical protein EGZ89_3528 [Erwinia amylovora]
MDKAQAAAVASDRARHRQWQAGSLWLQPVINITISM